MKHFKKPDGSIHAFEDDGSQDHHITEDMAPISEAELAVMRTPPLADLKQAAQSRIDAHYETLYQRSVVNSAIGAEYDAAFMAADRWVKNPTSPVPERVKALAESYGVTNEQAAAVVVQKWTEAQAVAFDRRGAARLRAKLAVRQAADGDGVAAAEAAGRVAMEAVVFSI